ncbi:MAG: hypothetical protein BroJett030_31100 [Alphaproteobacteria bacterium]|nr:MAG: hypothetical protein BroJett030_31100 [Alphaproteobacteria bacterium]
MQAVRDKAMFCVGRAVLFASLAIALIMLSFAFDPPVALKAGGVLGLVLSAVLIWYAQTAHRRAPKDTETWLLLEARFRPQGDQAERAFAAVMEEVYLFFATRAFAAAVGLLLAGLGFTLVAAIASPL